MIWFTSDTHFCHANIVRYCKRPFSDVKDMNSQLIGRWNARVQSADTVYHLGDFAFGPVDNIGHLLTRLSGRVFLILGNHDRSLKVMRAFDFAGVEPKLELELEGKRVLLTHQPRYGLTEPYDLNLCGHVHQHWSRKGKMINVGVDVRDFEPKTFAELLAKED